MECKDRHCPMHGHLKTYNTVLEGSVVSDKMNKTIMVARPTTKYVPKYERYERKITKIPAHKPECMNIKKGDRVRIAKCRPISKTKSFVVVEKL